jgi:hypothetical protein
MIEIEGMLSEGLSAQLREKWKLTEEPNKRRASITAYMLDNQDRHFKRLVEETGIVNTGEFLTDLSAALKSQMRTHVLPDLCSIQPMTGPLGTIAYYRPRLKSYGVPGGAERVPEIHIEIATAQIQAESRMAKAFRQADSDLMVIMVEELLTEIAREVLGTYLNAVTETSTTILEEEDDLKEKLLQASNSIHRRTQRAPANKIIASAEVLTKLGVDAPISNGQIQEICKLDGKWTVYMDPLFPKGHLMAWYQGDNELDTGIIYSPYLMFETTPNFVSPEDQTLRRALRVRQKITLVRPEFVYLLKPEEVPV